MKLLLVFVLAPLFLGTALAETTPAEVPAPVPVPCNLDYPVHDWDFVYGTHGFYTMPCDESAEDVWEYGSTSQVPDAPPYVWGTVLEGGYLNSSGHALVSTSFYVGSSTYMVEVVHWIEAEPYADGGNVKVRENTETYLIEPVGGYPVGEISSDPGFYAPCVDGEPGWSGEYGVWQTDCFDLSAFMGRTVALEFDFGSDESATSTGWYLAAVRIGYPAPSGSVCCHLDGSCEITADWECEEAGGDWYPEWDSCDPDPCQEMTQTVFVEIGSEINVEPWRAWLGPGGASVPLRLVVPRTVEESQIDSVAFSCSYDDGIHWTFIDGDGDGTEPALDTIGDDPPCGDGWSATYVIPDPIVDHVVLFRALAFTTFGDPIESGGARTLDPAPPSLGTSNLDDWIVSDNDTLGVEVDPGNSQIEFVIIHLDYKPDSLYKEVPGIDQHIHGDSYCAPTAAAQCLKYFHNHGDSEITGGRNDYQLVGALAQYMRTDEFLFGTRPSDWASGLAGYVADHGAGYSVSDWRHYLCDGWSWRTKDWKRMRGDLNQCHDVLLGIFWPEGGGHALTLDGIIGERAESERIALQFMDPWTGEPEMGELDPGTGTLYNLTGAGNGGTARVGITMIVKPLEDQIGGGIPGELLYDWEVVGEPPYRFDVPFDQVGYHSVYITLVNSLGHSHTIRNVVQYDPTTDAPDRGDLENEPLRLGPCIPNPFRASVALNYFLPRAGRVELAVYDVTGRKVRTLIDAPNGPGLHRVTWKGTDHAGRSAAAGIYYVKLRIEGEERIEKITLVR
ncbi:MAG: T9SS type A sorting domain-containing protein [Candidatus Eisenbacteria bacterium]|nr:T9SS type A sorting domain-containing protein [Candidatus Latescibacterota bacterium]MBD3301392.1 T9SS type A sorting domain-containing protein [Candidatus Eisenbacteria bacterium]